MSCPISDIVQIMKQDRQYKKILWFVLSGDFTNDVNECDPLDKRVTHC